MLSSCKQKGGITEITEGNKIKDLTTEGVFPFICFFDIWDDPLEEGGLEGLGGLDSPGSVEGLGGLDVFGGAGGGLCFLDKDMDTARLFGDARIVSANTKAFS